MNKNRLFFLLALLTTLAAISALLFSLLNIQNTQMPSPSTLILGGVGIGMIMALLMTLSVNRTPLPLSISILGFPQTGKTVYLTVLFNELMTKNMPFRFYPYGSETIEKVTSDMGLLSKGQWLPPTPKDGLFMYRANFAQKSPYPYFNKKYKIEIGDFAGEWSNELANKGNFWLHKTDYFKYVIQSDILILAIDCRIVIDLDINLKSSERIDIENSYIAALQTLIEGKNVEMGKKLRMPIAIAFLKCDLLGNRTQHITAYQIFKDFFPRLMGYITNNCKTYEVFAVSSVGNVEDGIPNMIVPYHVPDPIIWAISKFMRS